MKNCPYCKEEIDSSAKICPYCRKTLKTSVGTWIVTFLIILLIIWGVVANKPTEKNVFSETSLTLEEGHVGIRSEYGLYAIHGIVKNGNDKTYSYVQVIFNTYDKDGNNIGTCIANNAGLDANGSWKFETLCDYDENNQIARYELKEITGY